ncbi:DUF4372 domain-containing protein [Porphyromonas uenonis]
MANVTLFAQVIRLIPREIIQRLVKMQDTDKHAKGFPSQTARYSTKASR